MFENWDRATDITLAVFVGTLLAHLLLWVLTGRVDELRRGVRTLVASDARSPEQGPDDPQPSLTS